MVKNVSVLACSDKMLIKVEMWTMVLGRWWFSNFIPSPVEITRKLVSGGYKCGFFLPIKVRSPLDIIWSDGAAAQAVLEMSRPVTTALFAMWATTTIFEGLDIAHTLFLAMQSCDDEANTAVMKEGAAYFPSNEQVGTAVFYTTTWDPNGLCDHNPGDIRYPIGNVQVGAIGFVTNTGSNIEELDISLDTNGVLYDHKPLSAPAIGERVAFNLSAEFNADSAGAVTIRMHIKQSGQGAFSVQLQVTRFYLHFGPRQPVIPNSNHLVPPDPCRAPGMPRLFDTPVGISG